MASNQSQWNQPHSLPVIHIDQLADQLGVERRWIIEHWLKRDEPDDKAGAAPHFRDGIHVFFPLEEFGQWAKRRAYGSGCIDTQTDLLE